MPNDVPDWTVLTQVNLQGGISRLNLGDVGAPSLQVDSATEVASDGLRAGGVLASFKAAAGSTIAKVGALGAILAGSATSVSPLFGQAPTAGNLLVAWVRASASATEPTTAAAGWVKDVSVNAGAGWSQIWHKPNAAGGDAAPVFTQSNAGVSVMIAQLAEFSGAATASPTDQTGNANVNPGGSLAVVNAAVDAAFGDLVLMAVNWSTNSLGTTFTDTFNNGATGVNAGNVVTSFSGSFPAASFSYAIIPAATVAQPLGVAPWAYDAAGSNNPGGGVQASAVLAATPGKTYTCAMIAGSFAQVSGAAAVVTLQVLDGASVIFLQNLAVTAVAGSYASVFLTGLALKGTKGNSMTINFGAGVAGTDQSVAIGAYLR